MATGMLPPLEGGQDAPTTGAVVTGAKVGVLPPAREGEPLSAGFNPQDYDSITYDAQGKNPRGVKHKAAPTDWSTGLKKTGEMLAGVVDKAWDYTVVPIATAFATLESRLKTTQLDNPTPDTKLPKDTRPLKDAASEAAFQKVNQAVSDPLMGPGHLLALTGYEPLQSGPSRLDKATSGMEQGFGVVMDKVAESVEKRSGGYVTKGEANDVMRVLQGYFSVEGLKAGGKALKPLDEGQKAALDNDMHFLADSAKYKATKGDPTPLKSAAEEMQWSGVRDEHQAALHAEVLKALEEQEAKAKEGPKKPTEGESLSSLAQIWQKDADLRTPEEHAALKKYFKSEGTIPEEAQGALEAAAKGPEELTPKDKSLLKKYGPAALATAMGLSVWNTADASDGATETSALSAMMAVGAVLLPKIVKTLGEIRDNMSGPSLKLIEMLPAETKVISKQQLMEHLNKPGIAGPERMLLQKIVDDLPEKGKITPEKLMESLGPELAKWELEPEVVDKYADFGLTSIDRFNPRGAETVLYKMKGAESFEIPRHIDGERATNHFPDTPGVFGHVRRFVENGIKHVVELQSDAFQQLSRSEKGPVDAAKWEQVKAGLVRENGVYFSHLTEKLREEWVALHQRMGATLTSTINSFQVTAEQMDEHFKKFEFSKGRAWIESWSKMVDASLTVDEVMGHYKQILKEAGRYRELAEQKIKDTDPAKGWGAVSERLKPMAKFYSRRLIREELAESFKRREELRKQVAMEKEKGYSHDEKVVAQQLERAGKVRFASADTVAKVEGWPALDLRQMKEDLRSAKALWNEFENGYADETDLENFDHTPQSLQESIQRLEAGIKKATERRAADPEANLFAPEHQGIYDRYKKETEQFLRSIGGTIVKDKDGHEWFEVPVENKGLGLGPRAYMAGSMDPKMMGILAGASIGAILGYKYRDTLGETILGAMLGAGGVALAGKAHANIFTKSLAGTEAVKAAVKELSDRLYTVVQGSKADGLDMLNYIKRNLPEGYAAHAEEIANHLDNPRKFPISKEGQKILDDVIRPIQQANHAMVAALKGMGIETEDIVPGRGARRYFKGTSRGLAGLGQELDRGGRVGGNRTLSTRVPGSTDQAFFSYRTMSGQRLVGKLGKGGVVDLYNNGSVIGKGHWDPRAQEMSYANQKFRAVRPTMEEVETHTKMQYEREPLLAELDANLRLKSALANAYFLNDFKKMPGFSNLGFKPEPHEVIPEGWRSIPQLPALRGYKFEPRIAEALEDFAADQSQGFWHYASKVNRIFVGSMFWTPFLHIGNVAVHALQEKGVVGLMKNMPINLRTSMEAYKEVSQMGPKYRAYLRDGGSFMYPDRLLGDFNQSLLKYLGRDQKNGGAIAKAFGYANPADMLRRLYKVSGDALWKWNDIFMMQGYLEKEARGLDRGAAMRRTEAHVPSYRIPSRVLDSRALSKILSENGPLSFARYDYGRLRSYGETIRDLVGKDRSLAERGHALDQMAMLGLIMVAYDQLGDRVAKWLTGNDDASMMRLGSATIPQMIMDAWSGESDKRAPVVNLFHLSPVMELLPQVLANTDLYTRQDWAKTPEDAALKTAQQLSPVKLATDTTRDRNPTSVSSVFWSQLGIKDPTPEQVAKKEKRKQKRLAEREAQ